MSGQTLQNAFIPLPTGATAVYTSAGLAYYRHSDHLGSSRLATTPSRTLYSSTAYAPFGEPYDEAGTTDRSFTGQDEDTTSGMYDFLERRYNPTAGRWLSPDPAGLGAVDPTNPQTWNRYAYVMNNPLGLIDLIGEECYAFDGNGGCYNNGSGGGGGLAFSGLWGDPFAVMQSFPIEISATLVPSEPGDEKSQDYVVTYGIDLPAWLEDPGSDPGTSATNSCGSPSGGSFGTLDSVRGSAFGHAAGQSGGQSSNGCAANNPPQPPKPPQQQEQQRQKACHDLGVATAWTGGAAAATAGVGGNVTLTPPGVGQVAGPVLLLSGLGLG